jgi:hypothetical protein
MNVEDFTGRASFTTEAELIQRLRSVRDGNLGAFILSHDDTGPSLWICINGDIAYLHYFPTILEQHPGYQATGMTPAGCPETVWFEQVHGGKGGGFEMIAAALVSVEASYLAAQEFMRAAVLPGSIPWFEL